MEALNHFNMLNPASDDSNDSEEEELHTHFELRE